MYSNRSDRLHMDSSVARACILKLVCDVRADQDGGSGTLLINVVAGWNARGVVRYLELFAASLLSGGAF